MKAASFSAKRLHIYYSGWVQGVGFRFTAERVADSLGLTGWVKNLNDGRVEIVCEGNEQKLKDFLEKINAAFKAYVRDIDVEWGEAAGGLEGFDIRIDG